MEGCWPQVATVSDWHRWRRQIQKAKNSLLFLIQTFLLPWSNYNRTSHQFGICLWFARQLLWLCKHIVHQSSPTPDTLYSCICWLLPKKESESWKWWQQNNCSFKFMIIYRSPIYAFLVQVAPQASQVPLVAFKLSWNLKQDFSYSTPMFNVCSTLSFNLCLTPLSNPSAAFVLHLLSALLITYLSVHKSLLILLVDTAGRWSFGWSWFLTHL